MTPKTKKTVGIVAIAAGALYLWSRRGTARPAPRLIKPINVISKSAQAAGRRIATTAAGASAGMPTPADVTSSVGQLVSQTSSLAGTSLDGHVLEHYGRGSLGR